MLDAAVAASREAVRMQPNDAYAHFSLGVALFTQKKTDEAIAEYRQAIRIQPGDATFHDNLCEAFGSQGKLDDVLAEHRLAIRIQPDFANAHNTLGHVLSDVKRDHVAAAAEFRAAIKLQPDIAVYHFNLALALRNRVSSIRRSPNTGTPPGFSLTSSPPNWAWAKSLTFKASGPNRSPCIARPAGSSPGLPRPTMASRWHWSRYPTVALKSAPRRSSTHALRLRLTPRMAATAPRWPWPSTARVTGPRRSLRAHGSIDRTKGVDASNWFLLAMALGQKADRDEARKWFDQAVAWTREKDPKNSDLRQFWGEAAALLALPGPESSGEGALR